MTIPMFDVADEISKDLSNYEAMWFLLEEFNSGLQELAKEDWISFRLAPHPVSIFYEIQQIISYLISMHASIMLKIYYSLLLYPVAFGNVYIV